VTPPASNRQTVHYWDRIAETHPADASSRVLRLYSDAVYIPLLRRWLPERTNRILKTDLFDEAWSDGLVPVLASRAGHVVGTDLSILIRRHARQRYNSLDAVGADVRRLPFGDSVFDTVVSNSTLDHFGTHAEIVDGLSEIYRVLRPGGQLIISLDNLANPMIALRNLLPFGLWRRLGLVPYFVGATYRPAGLREALVRVGFDVAEMVMVMHVPRLLVRVLGGLFGQSRERAVVSRLAGLEWIGRAPLGRLTGQYIAADARKPAA
jgi:SAM-dependent methyltransferase